jgi:hypothetical protein
MLLVAIGTVSWLGGAPSFTLETTNIPHKIPHILGKWYNKSCLVIIVFLLSMYLKNKMCNVPVSSCIPNSENRALNASSGALADLPG